MSSPSHTRSRLRSVVGTVALIVLLLPSVLAQEATYFALQRPGQGSVAIDKQKQTAYITDLGKSGDGDKLLVDNVPLLDYLANLKVRHLVFTCSHPHSDHAGGIRALFEKPRAFFTDSTLKTARFESIDVIDNGVTDSLFSILKYSLGADSPIRVTRSSADRRNAFAKISSPDDDVFIENIPYSPLERPGPHGRSVVTRVVLGQKYSSIDFDDASSSVLSGVVNELLRRKIVEIDAFVVPHHGSAYHDIEPILRLKPKVAIMTVNPGNQFGHPSPSILLPLIEKLGAENVIFTGSADHVVLGPGGVKTAQYTAASRESYELFVEPNYKKAIAKNDLAAVALFKKIDELMVPKATEPNGDSPQTAAAESSKLTRDEIAAELDIVERTNAELFVAADRLALSTGIIPAPKQQKLRDSFIQQGQVMDRLLAHIQTVESASGSQLLDERARLESISSQIRHTLSPPPTQPLTHPFLDENLQGLMGVVASNIRDVQTTALRSPTNSRTISEIRYVSPLEAARSGKPEIANWSSESLGKSLIVPNQILLPYSEMVSPKTASSRPGGIVIGNVGRLEGTADLSSYVLRYDLDRQILVLAGPQNSELPFSHRLEPEVMKALYRFAASERSSAISLATTSTAGIARLVRLDDAFVDSSVGRDLIASDLIGWRLSLLNLPDGKLNPLASDFAQAEKRIVSCEGNGSRATLVDDPTAIAISGDGVTLGGGLRLEFMGDVDSDQKCAEMTCKPNPSGGSTCHFVGMERLAKKNYAEIMHLFPSLKRVDEYARIIGFLRWARKPGNLAAIDFSSLVGIQVETNRYRTPDALTSNQFDVTKIVVLNKKARDKVSSATVSPK